MKLTKNKEEAKQQPEAELLKKRQRVSVLMRLYDYIIDWKWKW